MPPHANQGIRRRFILSFLLTAIIFIAEVVGGLWTGSLALLSDAAHVFMDVFALVLSYTALIISARPADDRHTYGWHRLEVLAALVNGISLVIIAGGIWWEAIKRFQEPQPIRSIEMLVIAAIGLVVNLAVAVILHGGEHEHEHNRRDLNVHSAFLHVVGDAVSSVGVIVAAGLIALTGWQWLDPLVSILIGALILVSSWRVLRGSLHILVEGTPEGVALDDVRQKMLTVAGIRAVHDLHVWSICSGHAALSAHVEVEAGISSEEIIKDINQRLLDGFGIDHTTLQVETVHCDGAGCG